jgi:hypothetical protein
MIRTLARLSMTIAILLAFIPSAFAETRTISWSPVTSYTDGTLIEAEKTVSYSAYWTTDPGLGSLVTIGTSLTTTSTTFDPTGQGMTRGGTVYFTAKSVLNTGEVSSLSPAFAWVVPLVTPPPAVLSSLSISGPSSVNEGGAVTYTATGTWDDGTTSAVSPTWSENSSYSTIGAGGLLTASTVTSNQTVTVTATYGGKTGTMSVTIVDDQGLAPSAPKNLGIAGSTAFVSSPSVSSPSVSAPPVSTEIWRVNWETVTTNWNGTPIDPTRTVRYTAYWTDDPALSAASLRTLASSISGTALDFDPSANGMTKNQVVYFTARAILDTGEQSSLATSLTWRVENTGPNPPAKGKIVKK